MAINPLVSVIGKSLDALSMRQQVITHNLANMATPGYQPLQVSFEQALRTELERNGNMIQEPLITVHEASTDKVVLDQEVALLSQTVLQYQALIRGLNKQLAIMQLAITEGKR